MANYQSYRKYLLYLFLLVTLSISAYYGYQDITQVRQSEIVLATFDTHEVAKKIYKEEGHSVGIGMKLHAKVDIFEIYKKLVPESVVKEAVKAHNIPKQAPVITVAAAPPPPTAPPVPFKYIGKILGDEEYQVFVAFNEKYLVVKEGDIIQQTYKVEKISPPIMTVTYIPMNILQNMQIGEPN